MSIQKAPPGALVKALMAAGWTQAKIAEAIGTTQPTVYRMTSGEHETHRHVVIDRLRELAENHALLIEDAEGES